MATFQSDLGACTSSGQLSRSARGGFTIPDDVGHCFLNCPPARFGSDMPILAELPSVGSDTQAKI